MNRPDRTDPKYHIVLQLRQKSPRNFVLKSEFIRDSIPNYAFLRELGKSDGVSAELRSVCDQNGRHVAVFGDTVARDKPWVAHASVRRDVVHAAELPPTRRGHRCLIT